MKRPQSRRKLRIAIVLVIMMDTLRRLLGGEITPIDAWLLVIEVLVLAFIIFDSAWDKIDRFRRWSRKRQDIRDFMKDLDSLTVEETSELVKWVLESGGNPTTLEARLDLYRKLPRAIRRDMFVGTISEAYKPFLEKWAREQGRNS